jgi:hypothetical protein
MTVDEQLFLQAIATLGALENGTDTFEFLDAARAYAAEVGGERSEEEREAVGYYIEGVYLVDHDAASLAGIAKLRETLPGDGYAFARDAAWAFLAAWTQRYGGYNADLATRPAVINPGRRYR